MSAYLFLPFYLLSFWFGHAPLSLLRYFGVFNRAFFDFFSVPILLRTFFYPIKNEYRKGLVGFSIGMGIVLKSLIIFTSLIFFIGVLAVEVVLFCAFFVFPIATMALLIW